MTLKKVKTSTLLRLGKPYCGHCAKFSTVKEGKYTFVNTCTDNTDGKLDGYFHQFGAGCLNFQSKF